MYRGEAPALGQVVRLASGAPAPPSSHSPCRASLRQVNVQPQTRAERLSQQHREDLEKMRLRSRRESYCRYEVRPPRTNRRQPPP